MIQHLQIKIDKQHLNSVFSVLTFVLYNIITKTINCGTIISIIVFELIYLTVYQCFTLFIPLFFAVSYLLIALEESYHIIMLVVLEKQATITHIDITKISLGFVSLIGGVCICYTGMFKKTDLFYISLAGPIMPLLYLFILTTIFAIIQLLIPFNILPILQVLICSTFIPLAALIPLKVKNYISDGYRIFHFIHTNNISRKQTIAALIYTIKNMILASLIPPNIYEKANQK